MSINNLKILLGGCSIRGSAHVRKRMPKQDYTLCKQSSDMIIVAVADGLGSHAKSHKGSRIVCQSVEKVAHEFRKGISGRETEFLTLLTHLWKARIYPDTPDECGTTCLLAIRFPNADIFLAQLGDGCLVYELDGHIQTLSQKEYDFVNITDSIGSADLQNWNYCCLPDIRRDFTLYMHTDGIDICEDKQAWMLHSLQEETAHFQKDTEVTLFLRDLLKQSWEGELDDDRSLAYFQIKKGV